MSRNSMTPSRAFLTIGELVKIFMLGIVGLSLIHI